MAELVPSQRKTVVVPEKISEGDTNLEPFKVAQNDSPGDEKKEGGKLRNAFRKTKEFVGEAKEQVGEAKEQITEDWREGKGERREAGKKFLEDLGLKPKAEPQQGESGPEPEGQEENPGVVKKLLKDTKVIVPLVDLSRGGHSVHEALEMADRVMNPQERGKANSFLRSVSILSDQTSLPVIPQGVSDKVLNDIIKINFSQDPDSSAADLSNLTDEEKILVNHRMKVGKSIESSHELTDAEWQASIQNAEQEDYKVPADVNKRMVELEDYVKQKTGQGATQAPSRAPSNKGEGAAVEQPVAGVSNAPSTQYVAYVNGKQVSADLVVSTSLTDQQKNPVVLNRDALARLEGAIAECDDIVVTSSFRSNRKQTELHKDYLRGANPYPVAQPGFSKHQSGFAIDISVKNGDQEKIHAAMTKAGFVRPIPASDPVHWVYVGPVSSGKNPVTA